MCNKTIFILFENKYFIIHQLLTKIISSIPAPEEYMNPDTAQISLRRKALKECTYREERAILERCDSLHNWVKVYLLNYGNYSRRMEKDSQFFIFVHVTSLMQDTKLDYYKNMNTGRIVNRVKRLHFSLVGWTNDNSYFNVSIPIEVRMIRVVLFPSMYKHPGFPPLNPRNFSKSLWSHLYHSTIPTLVPISLSFCSIQLLLKFTPSVCIPVNQGMLVGNVKTRSDWDRKVIKDDDGLQCEAHVWYNFPSDGWRTNNYASPLYGSKPGSKLGLWQPTIGSGGSRGPAPPPPPPSRNFWKNRLNLCRSPPFLEFPWYIGPLRNSLPDPPLIGVI